MDEVDTRRVGPVGFMPRTELPVFVAVLRLCSICKCPHEVAVGVVVIAFVATLGIVVVNSKRVPPNVVAVVSVALVLLPQRES